MALSEDYTKIFDKILDYATVLDSKDKEQELLVELQALSSAEGSSGGDGENFSTSRKRKKPSGDDDNDNGDNDNDDDEQSAFFETMEDAFKAAIEELDTTTTSSNDVAKSLSFFVEGVEYKANDGESSKEFLARLKGKSVGSMFGIKAIDGWGGVYLITSDLKAVTKTQLREKIRQAFGVGSLVDIINDKCGPKLPTNERYISGMTKSKPSEKSRIISFPLEPSKAAAVVVSGESGSGKSAFVKHEFGKNRGWACIYHSIDDADMKLIREIMMLRLSSDSSQLQQQQRPKALQKLAQVFKKITEAGHDGRDLYNHLSELHYNAMKKRNEAAVRALEQILLSKIETHQRLKSWWKNETAESRVDKLVVVIDEAGRCPPFARGLVDSIRVIHSDWQQKNRCAGFKLVLTGSGLDGAIKDDSLPIDGDDSLYDDTASFGTDPLKSIVIVLEGPATENLETNLKNLISQDTSLLKPEAAEAILKGVYSRVLATNSRMLFDGVLPMLKNEELTYGFTDDRSKELQQRLIELCSTNVVMDYAVRKYIDLNGLQRLQPAERRGLLRKSFRFLLETSYDVVKGENEFAFDNDDKKVLKISTKDKLRLRQLGLVASNPLDTSSALRYLACEGRSVELIQSDGSSFEALVAAHLRCFEHVVRGFPTVQTHDLNEAWPPRMSKACATPEDVKKNFRDRFAEHAYTDVVTICQQLCKEKKKLAIVMQQRVPTAQSADVIVLESVWSETGDSLTLTLDLYQAKHYRDYRSDKIQAWAFSLGIDIGSSATTATTTSSSNSSMSAHYSDLGIRFFLECLKQRLEREHGAKEVKATIRNRVLVVSATTEKTKWDAKIFKASNKAGLKIWTRENLEPTCSAVTRGDTGVLAENGEDEVNWGPSELVEDFFLSSGS